MENMGTIRVLVACGTAALFAAAVSAFAAGSYTNHAHNVVSGDVVALDARIATISNASECVRYPLSIFPETEQRRIAADFVLRMGGGGQTEQLLVPLAVKRAVAGTEKAMARSRKRAAAGLCTQDECDEFCAKSEAALKAFLDRQVVDGIISQLERKAIGH